mmetsp:Transcript_6310/g.8001  ORF Transcript_6310/g.8001 Transcript_6310/m.8001 type:complete len:88 (-) Transcript_6310:2393-2656(-)
MEALIFYKVLAETKLEEAEATEASDKDRILQMVEDGPGISTLNNKVNFLIRRWVLDGILEAVNEFESELNDVTEDEKFGLMWFDFKA